MDTTTNLLLAAMIALATLTSPVSTAPSGTEPDPTEQATSDPPMVPPLPPPQG